MLNTHPYRDFCGFCTEPKSHNASLGHMDFASYLVIGHKERQIIDMGLY